jgi:hypothetical protein
MRKITFKKAKYFLVAYMLLTTAFSAANAQDEITNKLTGSWKGEGKMVNTPSHYEMNWEKVLGGKFIRLTYRVEMRDPSGSLRVFAGYAFYRSLGDGKYEATWFDSNGEQHSISAVFEADLLTANWGTPKTKLGRTTYRLVSSSEMELIDYIQTKDGNWREFNRGMLKLSARIEPKEK